MTSTKRNGLLRALMLAIAILFFMLTIPMGIKQVSATQNENDNLPIVRVENKTVHRGQAFEVEIYLDQNPGLLSLMLNVDYNKSVMELVGVEHGNALHTHTFTTSNTETDEGFLITPFNMLWDGRDKDFSTGVLVTLTFESNVEAQVGEYPITVNYIRQNTNVDYNTPTDVIVESGTVALTKGAYSVKYLNYDGTLLYEKDYSEDVVPSYEGVLPTRPTDERYSYVFNGWQGVVSDAQNVICYEATYRLIPQIYQVFFYVDGEYFNAFECAYGEFIDLTQIPSKKNYVFDGWYMDEDLTQKVTSLQMQANNLTLYGTLKFNIRENPTPEIVLSVDRIEGDYVYVGVDITQNPSLSGLLLTLDYDKSAMTFEGFEKGEAFRTLQFDHTNTDEGYSADPFRFYWEHTVNTLDTGRLLELKFKVDHEVPSGVYPVTMTYEPTTDAVYVNEFGELSYTKLSIIDAQIPIGEIYYWNEELEEIVDISVECPQGMPADTVLCIELVTLEVDVSKDEIQDQLDSDMELKTVYTIQLLRGEEKVQPAGTIKVRIKLTESQKLCTDLHVYHVDDENNMTLYDSHVEDGYVVFETDHLSYWAIVGNVTDVNSLGNSMPTNSTIVIIAFALLAISCMAFCLIMIAQKKGWMKEKSTSKGEDNT